MVHLKTIKELLGGIRMYQLHILRHGPKNNDPQAHQTGVEAHLDPNKRHKIIYHAASLVHQVKEILQEQVSWFRHYGKSKEVLEQRLAFEK